MVSYLVDLSGQEMTGLPPLTEQRLRGYAWRWKFPPIRPIKPIRPIHFHGVSPKRAFSGRPEAILVVGIVGVLGVFVTRRTPSTAKAIAETTLATIREIYRETESPSVRRIGANKYEMNVFGLNGKPFGRPS